MCLRGTCGRWTAWRGWDWRQGSHQVARKPRGRGWVQVTALGTPEANRRPANQDVARFGGRWVAAGWVAEADPGVHWSCAVEWTGAGESLGHNQREWVMLCGRGRSQLCFGRSWNLFSSSPSFWHNGLSVIYRRKGQPEGELVLMVQGKGPQGDRGSLAPRADLLA